MRVVVIAALGLNWCSPPPEPPREPDPAFVHPGPPIDVGAAGKPAQPTAEAAARTGDAATDCKLGDDAACVELMSDAKVFAHALDMVNRQADGFRNVLGLFQGACRGGHEPSCAPVEEYQRSVNDFFTASWITESEAAGLEYGWTLEQAQAQLGQGCVAGIETPETSFGKLRVYTCPNPDGGGVRLTLKDGKVAKIEVLGRLPP